MWRNEKLSLHIFPTSARTHNQHEAQEAARGSSLCSGIVEVVSGALGWRPFGQASSNQPPFSLSSASATPPRPSANKIKMSKTNLRDIKRICGVCARQALKMAMQNFWLEAGKVQYMPDTYDSALARRGTSCQWGRRGLQLARRQSNGLRVFLFLVF